MTSNEIWYCATASRERHGPMSAEALRARYDEGSLDAKSLVWCQGMPQWQPLETVANELGIVIDAAPRPATPEGSTPSPGRDTEEVRVPSLEAAPVLEPVPPAPIRDRPDAALAQAYAASARDASAYGAIDRHDVVDAGFLRRFAALMIDGLVLLVATYALIFILLILVGAGVGGFMTIFEASATGQPPPGPLLVVFVLGVYVLPFISRWAYYAFFHSSNWQGTPGKRLMGIKVVDLEGRRIGLGKATGRWFAAALSYMTFYIGFLMAAFTDRKQALHDIVVGTRVVDQWAYTAHPERQRRDLGGCGIAALVGVGLFFVLFIVGMIAAVSLPAYHDYTQRAKLTELVAEGHTMTTAIDGFIANTDRCPASLKEAGLDAPASELVAKANIGELESGECTLEFTLGEGTDGMGYAGEYLWFIRQEADRWGCSSSIDSARLPTDCRD